MNDHRHPDGQPQGDPGGGNQGRSQNDWQPQGRGGNGRQGRQSQRGKRGPGNLSSAIGPGDTPASQAIPEERMSFIRRVYAWLTGAIVLCVAMMGLFMNSPFFEPVVTWMHGTGWLLVLGLFIGFSWMGDMLAHKVGSRAIQSIGLMVGVGAYAVIFSYLFVGMGFLSPTGEIMASGEEHVLLQAGGLTLLIFGVLTGVVYTTKQDFSALRIGLIVMSVLALGAIVAGSLFGFTLGLGFAVAMVGLSSAFIVYQTSNILHHYPTDRHVGAALALFSSIGMLFWYLVIIFFDG